VSVQKHVESIESVVIRFWGGDSQERPMWSNANRARYDRSKLRYPSDLTEEEWAVIGPLIPPAKRVRA
jgi:hypothetical protein